MHVSGQADHGASAVIVFIAALRQREIRIRNDSVFRAPSQHLAPVHFF
jgi:hypothetical protein